MRVVVTGGSRGIGLAIVKHCLAVGHQVAIISRTVDRAVLSALGVPAWEADVTDEPRIGEVWRDVAEHWGEPPDALVNNAGITADVPILSMDLAAWDRIWAVNVTGPMICARIAAAAWIGAGSPGTIVNMASMSGLIVNQPQAQTAYNVSKAGLIMLTKSLAVEWAEHRIRVNAVAPGYVATTMTQNFIDQNPAIGEDWLQRTPVHRMGTPEEIARVVSWLLDENAGFLTGSVVSVDGGYTAV